MMKLTRIAAIGAAALALAACKTEVTSTVYITDVEKVLETNEAIATPATVAVEMPGTSVCDKRGGEVAALLQRYLNNFANPRCEGSGMDVALVGDFTIPMTTGGDASGPVAIAVDPAGDGVNLVLNVSKQGLQIIADDARDAGMPISGAPDLEVTTVLSNDTGEQRTVGASGAFVSGTPQPGFGTLSLRHRETVEIRLSNVGAAHAQAGNPTFLGAIMSEESATN